MDGGHVASPERSLSHGQAESSRATEVGAQSADQPAGGPGDMLRQFSESSGSRMDGKRSDQGSQPGRFVTTDMQERPTELRVSLSKEGAHLRLDYQKEDSPLLTQEGRTLLNETLKEYYETLKQPVSLQSGRIPQGLDRASLQETRQLLPKIDTLQTHIGEFKALVQASTRDYEARKQIYAKGEKRLEEISVEIKAIKDIVNLEDSYFQEIRAADIEELEMERASLLKSRIAPKELAVSQGRIGWCEKICSLYEQDFQKQEWRLLRASYDVSELPAQSMLAFAEKWEGQAGQEVQVKVETIQQMMRERLEGYLLDRAEQALTKAVAESRKTEAENMARQKTLESLQAFREKKGRAEDNPYQIELHLTQLDVQPSIWKWVGSDLLEHRDKQGVIYVTNNAQWLGRELASKPIFVEAKSEYSNTYGDSNRIMAKVQKINISDGSVVKSHAIHFYEYFGVKKSIRIAIWIEKNTNMAYITDSEVLLAQTLGQSIAYFSSMRKQKTGVFRWIHAADSDFK